MATDRTLRISPIEGEIVQHNGYDFLCYNRGSIVTKCHCVYKITNGCRAILWIWNDFKRQLINWHENHPEDVENRNVNLPETSIMTTTNHRVTKR